VTFLNSRDDADPAKYVTVYRIDEFRKLPTAVKERKEIAHLSAVLEEARQGLDEAYKSYFKSRTVGGRLMINIAARVIGF
jgi:hypothetical protein